MKRKFRGSKYVGSCGMYLFAVDEFGIFRLLVHRRSQCVSEPRTIAAPGGIVERDDCGDDGTDFTAGAMKTAERELAEETGISLVDHGIRQFSELPVGKGCYWGESQHRNYFVVIDFVPKVRGPQKNSEHEVVFNGMQGLGEPAGDGYHAWVDIHELLLRDDLMKQCRAPLEHFSMQDSVPVHTIQEPIQASTLSSANMSERVPPTADLLKCQLPFRHEQGSLALYPPPLKNARGSVALALSSGATEELPM